MSKWYGILKKFAFRELNLSMEFGSFDLMSFSASSSGAVLMELRALSHEDLSFESDLIDTRANFDAAPPLAPGSPLFYFLLTDFFG